MGFHGTSKRYRENGQKTTVGYLDIKKVYIIFERENMYLYSNSLGYLHSTRFIQGGRVLWPMEVVCF